MHSSDIINTTCSPQVATTMKRTHKISIELYFVSSFDRIIHEHSVSCVL